jgi:hypothetical protein
MTSIKIKISTGDNFLIVYNWRLTADEVRKAAHEVKAFTETKCGPVWHVQWDGIDVIPSLPNVDGVNLLMDADLELVIKLIQEVLRERAH